MRKLKKKKAENLSILSRDKNHLHDPHRLANVMISYI